MLAALLCGLGLPTPRAREPLFASTISTVQRESRGKNGTAKIVAVEYRPSDELCCCETECPCLADADGPFELTTAGSILELDECPGDESADDIPMNAADE